MDGSEVVRVLDALQAVGIRTGITGGWGVDALLRHETRLHQDVDLGLDSARIDLAIETLVSLGYVLVSDERPARLEFASALGRVDLHPIVWDATGAGVQTGFGGETFDYPPRSLDAEGEIDGRIVRCGTPGLQLAFHQRYAPRDHDRRDMAALAETFGLTLPPSYDD